MTHGMVMILSGLLKHVRGGLDLKRFDHILIRVGGGTGTKKNRLPSRFCEKPPSFASWSQIFRFYPQMTVKNTI